MFTVMGSAAATGAAAAFTGGFRSLHYDDGGLAIPGVLATVGAVVWTAAGAFHWYELAHPPGEVRVQPSVSLSGRGAALGLQGSF
jgi:hypothetical protein